MINAWLVVRTEKHIDDRYWVCLRRADALAIAKDVAGYWANQYSWQRLDRKRIGDSIFSRSAEECFTVDVIPQMIRENGEIEQL